MTAVVNALREEGTKDDCLAALERALTREEEAKPILRWLSGRDTGLSSKAIALSALGAMPDHPDYPSDGSDFGRCVRLIESCPGATAGLDHLAAHGGPVWAALAERWDVIKSAWKHDAALLKSGRLGMLEDWRTYPLMRSIIETAKRGAP